MNGKRLLVHTIFLFLLPLIVAWFGISLPGALVLVALALLWRWAITLTGLLAPAKVPDLELETIAASHFVEKVRWSMDRLGVDYTERQWVGVLGVFTRGRTVPQLKIRTGTVRSTIGNSPEILRYLWGAYAATLGEKARFLEPTAERLAFEERLDRYGVNLQVWVYYHILDNRKLTQHAWGCYSPGIPAWQRYLVIGAYPVLRVLMRRAFRISHAHYAKAVEQIELLLAEVESMLTDESVSILGDKEINFVDITFAALSALWLQPAEFGRQMAHEVRVDLDNAPSAMNADRTRWIETYPVASEFINRLFQRER
jgi:glutathione S-transferase